jgi:hypothetical protein
MSPLHGIYLNKYTSLLRDLLSRSVSPFRCFVPMSFYFYNNQLFNFKKFVPTSLKTEIFVLFYKITRQTSLDLNFHQKQQLQTF